MALLTIEGRYSNGHIYLNEQPAGVEAARVIVTFLPDDPHEQNKEAERQAAMNWLFARMEQGINLGGVPYYTKREEIYDERLKRLDKGNR